MSKVWLITGASSGFGLSMTKLVLERGDIVVATLRNPEALSDIKAQYSESQLLIIQLDVTRKEEIEVAFKKAFGAFGRVDVVYNNAGIGAFAYVEVAPDELSRQIFEANFWGASNVAREAVRFFREVNKPQGGLLIQMSSTLGFRGTGGVGYYSASKFALEGLTEALMEELDPTWNIKVTILEPGYFRTFIGTKTSIEIPPHPAYPSPLPPSSAAQSFPGCPEKLSKAVYDLACLDDPPRRLMLGKDALEMAKTKITETEQDMEKYKLWSEDLLRDDL